MVKNKKTPYSHELTLLARLLIASLFTFSAFGKITNFSGPVQMVGNTYPFPELLVIGSIILLTIGVVSITLGYYTKIGVSALLLFLIAATVMFHIGEGELQNFIENLALIGGVILLGLHGPGKYSIDKSK